MSRTLRNLLAATVITAVVGGASAAQAASINSPVTRRQHPGTSFFSSAPHLYHNVVARRSTTARSTSVRAPLFYSTRVSTPQRQNVSHRLTRSHSGPVAAQHLTWSDIRS